MDTWQLWAGRVITALVIVFLLGDAATALLTPEELAPQMAETGFPEVMIRPVGIIALVAAILYAVPRTAVLGAILVTGFVGGAIAIHFRLGEMTAAPQLLCAGIGVLAWAGLWLRNPQVRALLPLGYVPART